VKASCPLNILGPLTGVSGVLTEPRSVLVVVSYASPTTYNGPLTDGHVADTGTIRLMLELYDVPDPGGGWLRYAEHGSAETRLFVAATAKTTIVKASSSAYFLFRESLFTNFIITLTTACSCL